MLGIDLWSPNRVEQNKIKEKCKCCPRDSKSGYLDQNTVMTHKSYINKCQHNAAYIDQNQDLGIPTRCINLYYIILGRHDLLKRIMIEASWLVFIDP